MLFSFHELELELSKKMSRAHLQTVLVTNLPQTCSYISQGDPLGSRS